MGKGGQRSPPQPAKGAVAHPPYSLELRPITLFKSETEE